MINITLDLSDIITTLDISLPATHDDDEGGEAKHVIVESTTDTPTTLPRGKLTAALDIFIAALEAALDEDEGYEPKHVIDGSTTDTP